MLAYVDETIARPMAGADRVTQLECGRLGSSPLPSEDP